ncbi:histidine phosphatase family protein [Candidatus Kaiserbacteria bacterium]|nr:histidine phosphatase family protein [Candidatus Kaiserbacteria bacterium]
MKKIYFIRHGESQGNVGNAWQGPHGSLTQKGRSQAASVAERMRTIPFSALISSPFERAKETAEAIVAQVGKEIEFSELFVERRRPTELIGVARNDPRSLEVDAQINMNFGTSGWRHSDEENFEDMMARAKAALTYLAEHSQDEIAVVTHGFFMRVMLAAALAGENLTPELCEHFLVSFRTANTGISLLMYDEKAPRSWWLWTWNDHAHLMGK